MTSNLSSSDAAPPSAATNAVLVASGPVPEGAHEVRGVDFDRFQGRDITVAEMVDNMADMGFQGSAVAEAARVLNDMVLIIPYTDLVFSCSTYRTDCSFSSVPIATPKRERGRPFSWDTPPISFPRVFETPSVISFAIVMSRPSSPPRGAWRRI